MPEYSFICNVCQYQFNEIMTCKQFKKRNNKNSKFSCPNCKERLDIEIDFSKLKQVVFTERQTLGSLIDKNNDTITDDEKKAIHKKNNPHFYKPVKELEKVGVKYKKSRHNI